MNGRITNCSNLMHTRQQAITCTLLQYADRQRHPGRIDPSSKNSGQQLDAHDARQTGKTCTGAKLKQRKHDRPLYLPPGSPCRNCTRPGHRALCRGTAPFIWIARWTIAATSLKAIVGGAVAGTILQNEAGLMSFRHDESYQGAPLSLSMPVSNRIYSQNALL